MTVEPNGSPAAALPSHQPTCWMSAGICRTPFTVCSGSTTALLPLGSSICPGTNRTLVLDARAPWRAGPGEVEGVTVAEATSGCSGIGSGQVVDGAATCGVGAAVVASCEVVEDV